MAGLNLYNPLLAQTGSGSGWVMPVVGLVLLTVLMVGGALPGPPDRASPAPAPPGGFNGPE